MLTGSVETQLLCAFNLYDASFVNSHLHRAKPKTTHLISNHLQPGGNDARSLGFICFVQYSVHDGMIITILDIMSIEILEIIQIFFFPKYSEEKHLD